MCTVTYPHVLPENSTIHIAQSAHIHLTRCASLSEVRGQESKSLVNRVEEGHSDGEGEMDDGI